MLIINSGIGVPLAAQVAKPMLHCCQRQRASERQDLLIAELNHRVRNILGLIRGLISQSKGGATDIESFAATIGGRVQALARAHDQITESNWGPRPLESLIANEAGAYVSGGAPRVQNCPEHNRHQLRIIGVSEIPEALCSSRIPISDHSCCPSSPWD